MSSLGTGNTSRMLSYLGYDLPNFSDRRNNCIEHLNHLSNVLWSGSYSVSISNEGARESYACRLVRLWISDVHLIFENAQWYCQLWDFFSSHFCFLNAWYFYWNYLTCLWTQVLKTSLSLSKSTRFSGLEIVSQISYASSCLVVSRHYTSTNSTQPVCQDPLDKILRGRIRK